MVQQSGTGDFADITTSAPGKYVAITFDDFLADALAVAGRALVEARLPSTWFVVTNALGGRVNWIRTSQFENVGAQVASSDDLARLDPDLFRIASHTCSHSPLPRLPAESLDAELRDSRSQLEALCPGPVTSLSFPYGEYDNSVLERCASTGYQFVFANVPVWSRFSCGGILRGRVPVEPEDWPIEFWLKLRGGYDWLALPGYLRHQLIPSWQRNRRISHNSQSTVPCTAPLPRMPQQH
jgi:peptidoglycan/xylan/chitin deacetylase (PgdA/CDA1 family)